ncbi:hypothetical protein VV02_20525 [Luteipulveratus mongoliensis]|uniref:EamA domain-containing protein n=2 Tax=Luteipulveratus mongoliensis TaxID=571913 RepID=A0A0K1JR02_9MICO|nr:hypothetical protein VV02_20525 [Luteipulveratus mongoliensis]
MGVTLLMWASAFVAIRHLGHELSGGPLAFGRLLVASVVLGVVVLIDKARSKVPGAWPDRTGWLRVIACGVLWFGIYNVALNEGERRVDAGTAAMLVNVGPVLLAVLAGLFLGEGFPRRLVVGTSVAFAGVVVIGIGTSTGGAQTAGVALCLLSALTYALAVVAQKPLLATMSALRVTWLAIVVATVCCLPYAPGLVDQLADSGPATVGWVIYLGVGPTALAFTTWAYALARSTAGSTGMTTLLVPPLTILLGWLLLGEAPPALAYAGGALCLAGVVLARRKAQVKPAAPSSRPAGS